MNNLLSYCGLTDARISASEKDLPVKRSGQITRSLWLLFYCKIWRTSAIKLGILVCNLRVFFKEMKQQCLKYVQCKYQKLTKLYSNFSGYALGAGSALLGREAAMACTVAVEAVITEHYNDQIRALGSDFVLYIFSHKKKLTQK